MTTNSAFAEALPNNNSDSRFRTIIYTSGSGRLKGFQRTYTMESADNEVMFTADTFGHYFGEKVELEDIRSDKPSVYLMKPNRKLLNNGFTLLDDKDEVVLTIFLRQKAGIRVVNESNGTELSTKRAFVKKSDSKMDKLVNALDEYDAVDEYYIVLNGENLLYANYGSRVIEQAEESPLPNTKLGRLKKWFTTTSEPSIHIDSVTVSSDVDDLMLFTIAMVQHEFTYARSR